MLTMRPPAWLVVVLVGATLGIVFAGVATYDFVQHLDRQVHSLHCSFIPGMGHDAGTSGCQVAMMSPYSSVFRTHVWGGVPISLGALAVFAFIGFYAVDLLLTRRKSDPRATGFLALATLLPAATSLIMLTISLTKLGTTCKLCIGIYLSSALCLAGAGVLWRRAVHNALVGSSKGSSAQLLEVSVASEPASTRFLGVMFGLGVLFVVVPVALYFAVAPNHAKFIGTCDGLVHPDDTYGVMVRLHHADATAAPALEILDPLCPACKAFEERLASSGFVDRLDRKAILFPLDSTCNWMVTETTHPGACTVSQAVLCAGDKAPEVVAWAFEEQERIRNESKADPAAAARIVKQRFPELGACLESPEAKARLNKSLRWAVANNIRVLTPQLFIDNVKLCDEDVDLGLDYMLTVMLDLHAKGSLAQSAPAASPAPPPTITGPTEPVKPTTPATDHGAKPTERETAKEGPVTTPESTDKPSDKSTDKPSDKPADKSIDKPGDKPTDKPTDKPIDRPAEQPSGGSGSQGGAP
jgi:uncharacterized membrane protein